MKHKAHFFKHLLFCLSCVLATQLSAQVATSNSSETSLIQSMRERLPALMQLKLKGQVGENNQGLIEARTMLEREQKRLVADENRDRLAHYKLIAGKFDVSIRAVQRKRAEQIREKSPKDVWLQAKGGDWYRK